MEIEVIDKKARIALHKDDVTNYQRLVKDVANKIADVEMKAEGYSYSLSKNKKEIARFLPIIFGEENVLEGLIINLYDAIINAESVKQSINTHLNNCKGLNKVLIQTYY
jgi:hypothetical protein